MNERRIAMGALSIQDGIMVIAKINNDLYRDRAHLWWADDAGEFSTIRFFINSVRFGYFEKILDRRHNGHPEDAKVLDVGSGGGFLSEEFARAGFRVTGVDPAKESLDTARAHAAGSGLTISYEQGSGEALPFGDSSFDYVACCDVLEHVNELDRVVSEISRVLKPGGLFFYDTINRTVKSWMGAIKAMQEWRATAFVPANVHVWEKFVKPRELLALFEKHGLRSCDMRGLSSGCNPISILLNLRRCAKGRISYQELGRRLNFGISNDLSISYIGYAKKTPPNAL